MRGVNAKYRMLIKDKLFILEGEYIKEYDKFGVENVENRKLISSFKEADIYMKMEYGDDKTWEVME